MNKISQFLLSAISYILIGHVLGLVIGFTLFDPDSDIYALLSPVLVIVGGIISVLPAFRQRVAVAFGALIGFYVGMLIAILLWGSPEADNFLEAIELGGRAILLSFILAVMGGIFGARFLTEALYIPAAMLMVGGFVGGALFATMGLTPSLSMIGVAPSVFGCGIVAALIVWRLQQGFGSSPITETSS